jgi:hypothetical protein
MSAFDRLARKGEKKTAILKALDFLSHKENNLKGGVTKRAITDHLGETHATLEYWFQLLKKEGVIDITGGAPGVPATISWTKKPGETTNINQVVAPKKDGILTGDPPSSERVRVKETALIERGIKPPPPVHPCPNHEDREQKVGRNGRRLGVCDECLSTRDSTKNLDRAREGGRMVQLYFHDKHLDLKAWLDKEAESNERTIQQEIIYLLKQARIFIEGGYVTSIVKGHYVEKG